MKLLRSWGNVFASCAVQITVKSVFQCFIQCTHYQRSVILAVISARAVLVVSAGKATTKWENATEWSYIHVKSHIMERFLAREQEKRHSKYFVKTLGCNSGHLFYF